MLHILLLLSQPREALLSSLLPLVPTAGSSKPGNRFLPSCLLAKGFHERWSGAAMRLGKPGAGEVLTQAVPGAGQQAAWGRQQQQNTCCLQQVQENQAACHCCLGEKGKSSRSVIFFQEAFNAVCWLLSFPVLLIPL